jgi:signal transduction histidine kinase
LRVPLEDFCRTIPTASFRFLGEETRLDARLEIILYRSACELIGNAVKHASAGHIYVQLLIDSGLISLSVIDDGKGFDASTESGTGVGLKNIRTRIAPYNGKMFVRSATGMGTEVNIEIEPS